MNMTFEFAANSKKPENLCRCVDFSSADFGGFDQIKNYVMENKEINLQCGSKLFLNKVLGLSGAEISINTIQKSAAYLGKHTHKENEEVYIVLSGEGFFLAAGKEIKINEGSVIRVKTGVVRAIKSNSPELTYICIQARENSLENYTLTDAKML